MVEEQMAEFEPLEKARKSVADRAELPGMSLMEHLEELRKRLIHSVCLPGRRRVHRRHSFTTSSLQLFSVRCSRSAST